MVGTVAQETIKFTDFIDVDTLVPMIAAAVDGKRPFSFVRFSHCESRLVGFRRCYDRAEVMGSIHQQWGRVDPPDADLQQVSDGILRATLEADVIALNDRDRTGAQPLFLEQERIAHELARDLGMLDGRPVARVSDHWRLGASPAFESLLARQGRIVLVTGRREAARRVATWLGKPDVRQILSPGHARQDLGDGANDRHYPDGLDRMLGELRALDVGSTLVIVGAGLLGKIVCGETRRLGGIAVDVGSLFDAWCGRRTRTTMPPGLELPAA